jgi:anti-sigma B factor antagonist
MKTLNGQTLEVRSLPTGQGTVIVALAGEVDLSSVAELRRELEYLSEAGARRIVIDATDLNFMDSTGIHVLVMAHRTFVDRGGGVEVYNAGRGVRRTLDLSGVTQHLRTTSLPGVTPVAIGSVEHEDS